MSGRIGARLLLRQIHEKLFAEISASLGFSTDSDQNSILSGIARWITSSQSSQRSLRSNVECLKESLKQKEKEGVELALAQAQKDLAFNRTTEFLEVVRQIQHDIRGPLQTLCSVIDHPSVDPDDKRILVATIQKIRLMLGRLTLQEQMVDASVGRLSDQVAEILIRQVVQEKKIAIKSSQDIKFTFSFDRKALNLVRVDSLQFNLVISNVIQNAIEAIGRRGKIKVTCRRRADSVFILVNDSGKGVKPEIKDKLFQKGATFGKAGGSGLGLSHAKSCIERWGGEISLESDLKEGTTVIIRLPLSETRANLIASIKSVPGAVQVLVDDEIEVLTSIQRKIGKQLVYFDSPIDFLDWQKTSPDFNKVRGIFDYNLKADLTGLDLISSLPIPSSGVLLTSDYDRPEVLKASAEQGFTILPKVFV